MFGWLKDKVVSTGEAIGSAVETGLTAVASTAKAGGAYLSMVGKVSGSLVKNVAKKVPVLGAVVTTGFVLYEAGSHAFKGDFKLMGASLVVGVPEIAGNVIGLGVGDIAREASRGAFVGIGGSDFKALERSDILTLVNYGAQSFGWGDDDVIQSTMTPHSSLAFGNGVLKGNFNASSVAVNSVPAASCLDELLQNAEPGASINSAFNGAADVPDSVEAKKTTGLSRVFKAADDSSVIKAVEQVAASAPKLSSTLEFPKPT